MSCPFHELIEPAAFQSTPFDAYQRLVDEGKPVWIDDESVPEGGAWAVAKREQLDFISTNPSLFSSSDKGFVYRYFPEERMTFLRMLLLGMDPPEHRHYRKIVAGVFKQQSIEQLMPMMRERAKAIVDRVLPQGECDFVTDVAAELPLQVICEIVGVPQQDRHDIMRWANAMIARDDPRYNPTGVESDEAEVKLFEYGMALGEKLLADEQSTALGRQVLLADIDGDRISPDEFWAFFYILLLGGTETTRTALTNGIYHLIQHPEQLQALRDNPNLMDNAIEEILRFDPPISKMQRCARQDVEVGGVTIKKGDRIILFYPATNRDSEVFDSPEAFDISRGERCPLSREHRSFGVGEHFCLGVRLARAEMKVMLEQIIPRMQNLHLLSPLERIQSAELTAAKSMRVGFDPA